MLQRLQCDCLLYHFLVWEVILNVVRSFFCIPLYLIASLIYFRFYLCIYPYSEVISSIMYEASDSRFLDKSFVVLVLKVFFPVSLGPGRVGTRQQRSLIRPGGGIGN